MSLEIMLSHSRSLKFIRNYTAELGISSYYNKVSILYFVQTTFLRYSISNNGVYLERGYGLFKVIGNGTIR